MLNLVLYIVTAAAVQSTNLTSPEQGKQYGRARDLFRPRASLDSYLQRTQTALQRVSAPQQNL